MTTVAEPAMRTDLLQDASPEPAAEDAVEAYLASEPTRRELLDSSIVTERIKLIRETEEQKASDAIAARNEAARALTAAEDALDLAHEDYAPAHLNFFLALNALEQADRTYQLAWKHANALGPVPVKRIPVADSSGVRVPTPQGDAR